MAVMALHLIVAAALHLLSSLVYAIPFEAARQNTVELVRNVNPDNVNMTNFCTAYTYIDQVSENSPRADDCFQIGNGILLHSNPWVGNGQKKELFKYRTCAFGLESSEDPEGIVLKVGNGDIAQVIATSKVLYTHNGFLGTTGSMNCKRVMGPGTIDNVQWRLYRTNYVPQD
ncbi:putative necrosis-inducing factor-domain-containing protein [Rhypophila decipiens]|uniref:Necrosis-inducing factor-domain-containing protein n=1 Tax=Rhypophila decipiens TaxID=261697 RepID=A0AAN6Y5T7_9PEZI|nr:putative necrosis-inducing factor-domain-containing protein [Rhypophila decipiens]